MPEGQAPLAQPWIQTPAFLQDRAARIHAALHALNDVVTALVAAHRLNTDTPKYKQWKALLANWGSWYGQTSGTTWLWTGSDATMQTYEQAIKTWERWLLQAFPDTASSLPAAPPEFGPDGRPKEGVPVWVWGAGAVGVGFALAKYFQSR